MAPRMRLRSLQELSRFVQQGPKTTCLRCQYATVRAATVPAPSEEQLTPTVSRYSSVQPPSHRSPAYHKSQLLRSYVSLLQTTPLIILFQYNNLRAKEWVGIRRELVKALRKTDETLLAADASAQPLAEFIKLEVIRTNIFEPALRITEHFRPDRTTEDRTPAALESEIDDPRLTHVLSRAAYNAAKDPSNAVNPLTPLLSGPICLLTLPTVSPQHLRTALTILSPMKPNFPAPTRRANPDYWDPPVQDGIKKLMLLGARVEGQIFDMEGTRWVGSIEGGLQGLQAELVHILQSFGIGLASTLDMASTGLGQRLAGTLEGTGKNLWFTVEGRRAMLEEEQKPQEGVVPEQTKP